MPEVPTVAIEVLLLDQTPPVVTLDRFVVAVSQIVVVPVMAATAGKGFTVIVVDT
jgi:hypothetical protein